MSVLARAGLRYLTRHPAQLALAVLGVGLGVAVVIGIDLAAGAARRSFEAAGERIGGRATHQVRGPGRDLDERLYVELARAPRGPHAPRLAPVLERVVRPREGGPALVLLGVDPLAEGPFRAPAGSGPGTPLDALELLGEPGSALVGARTAERLGVRAGDALELVAESRVGRVRVRVAPDGDERLAGLLLADLATAQELTGAYGRLTRIDVRAQDEAALAPLRAQLPPGHTIEPAAARRAGFSALSGAFETNLRALGLLALFVGAFLVYNTATFSVVQRRRLFAALRTLGVRRVELLRLLGFEALVLGLAGSALGIALGRVVGGGLVHLVARTVNDMYYQVDVDGLTVEPWAYARGLALGLAGTLAAAAVPALEASREKPRSALARSSLESGTRSRAPWAALAGALVLGASLALLHLGPRGLASAFAALFGLLAGAALCAPLFTLGVSRAAVAPLGALAGATGRIAARGIARHLSRHGVAVGALAVAVSATLGMGLLIESFRRTVEDWLGLTLAADVYVSAPSDVASRNHADLPADLPARLRARADVRALTTYRGFEARDVDGRLVFAAALELAPAAHGAYDFVGEPPADLWARWERGQLLISEPLARKRGLGVGDTLELVTDLGPRRFPVAAVYRDYSNDQGFALMSRATYEAGFADRGVSSVSLYLAPGVQAEDVVDELLAARPAEQVYFVRSNADLRATSLSIFDRTFRVTAVLRLFSGAVAFVAILSALLALQLEREREVGVLRALGLTPRGVRTLVLLETGLLGCAAGLCALPLGAALAWLLAAHVNLRAFGWSIAAHWPPAPFVEAFALALGAALLAALWPAWRLSRGSPGRSLWNE